MCDLQLKMTGCVLFDKIDGGERWANNITLAAISQILTEKVLELQIEPEFQKTSGCDFAADPEGNPLIKVAVGNVPLDYDLWDGLRNPAVAGIYPAGLPELWEFYANRRKQKVDEAGRQTIFQVPRSFDFAKKTYRRVLIISVMLPFSPTLLIAMLVRLSRKSKVFFLVCQELRLYQPYVG